MKPLLFMLLLVVASGCREADRSGPPAMKPGQDECVHCGMIINDVRYAAGIVQPDGKALLFDDIGDMIDYLRDNPALPVARRYVHDQVTKQWLPAEQAHYVHHPELHTPMGSGIAAFTSDEAAGQQPGRRVTLEELSSLRAAPATGRQ